MFALIFFGFRIIVSKCSFFRFFYLQENHRWLHSVKRAWSLPQDIWSSQVCKFQKYEKNINHFGRKSQLLRFCCWFLSVFLALKWQMVATFSETSAITSKIYVVKQGMDSSKFFRSYEFFVLSSSLKNVNSCK